MLTKPLVVGLLAAACVSAAAGGAYMAVRQNASDRSSIQTVEARVSATELPAVEETEAVVAPQPEPAAPLVAPAPAPGPIRAAASQPGSDRRAASRPRPSTPGSHRARTNVEPRQRPSRAASPAPTVEPAPAASSSRDVEPATTPADEAFESADPVVPAYERSPEPGPVEASIGEAIPARGPRELIQVVVPASSVIGLQIETAVSTERARLEDRVDARVTRDVMADGHVAIPAGSRVIGSVTLVEPGGKIKERARLGVRFHTIVFADGSELPIRTEAIYRDGESPGSESAKKIGGAAVGGAILGAILGGGKGAMIGGAAGAAGGTAATMAGGRNPATLPAGTVVTVRLAEPLALDRERHER